MDATTIDRAIQQLQQNILNSMHHETLIQHLGEPALLERQLFFLLLPQFNGENWSVDAETAVKSVGIVHASLAEHAKINEQEITKEQQLTVLSGDFYSGRYYQILAHEGNIQLIKALSKAIVKRSEQTVLVLENLTTSLEQWIDAISTVETALIEGFYDVYNLVKYKPLMIDVLMASRLNEIIKAMKADIAQYVPEFIEEVQLTQIVQMIQQNVQNQMQALNLHAQLQQKINEFVS